MLAIGSGWRARLSRARRSAMWGRLCWGMGSGTVRRRATAEPTVPKPRIPTRQRWSRSVGLLPDVWNEFSGTFERLYQTRKNQRKNFYRYIYIRGCIRDILAE